MYQVERAEYLFSDRQHEDPVEIRFQINGFMQPFIAVLKTGESNNYELIGMYEEKAVHELDWYENSQHQAYPQVLPEQIPTEVQQNIADQLVEQLNNNQVQSI